MSLELAILGEIVLDTWGTDMLSYFGGRVLSGICKSPGLRLARVYILYSTLLSLTVVVLKSSVEEQWCFA